MQSERLAQPPRSEERPQNRRPLQPDPDNAAGADRMGGVQQFFVEWEVAESS
jgi:hypothetical protein